MRNAIQGFFDNDSVFGQIMTRCGTVIAANILFLLCCLPIVTLGAGWAALHYTMMRTLREKTINPFSVFWKGLKENWKQATVSWIVILLLAVFLVLEIYWCTQFDGVVGIFRYGVLALLLVELVLATHLFPVMAAFRGTIGQLLRNSIYFAVRRPQYTLLILVLHVVPIALTYLDAQRMPLYAFLWVSFGFGAVAMLTDKMLLRQFSPYLSQPDDQGTGTPPQKSEKEILEEMKRMGF